MSESPSLRDVRRRTMRLMQFEDGLWDLLLGMIFMLLAVYPVTRARLGPEWNAVFVIGLMLLFAAIQLVVRRRFSVPRLGYARPRRSPALRLILAITILLFVLTLGLLILTLVGPGWFPKSLSGGSPVGGRSYLMEIIVLLAMVGIFSGMAYVFGVSRLYLYGWLLGGSNLAAVMMYRGTSGRFDLPMAAAAGIIILVGVVLLVRFIRRYPVWTAED
jgi:hypothetical protein